MRHASRFLLQEALEIFRVQLFLQPLNKYGRRWPDGYKAFAMNLYFHRPEAYIYLSKMLLLPSVKSLQNWSQDIVLEPGIMPTVLATLQKKMENWPVKDQACTLLFDQISLKSNHYYDPKKDRVHGFCDTGEARSPELAGTALVVALSGTSKQWIQAIAFMLGKAKVDAAPLKQLLLKLITDLKAA